MGTADITQYDKTYILIYLYLILFNSYPEGGKEYT